MRRVSVRCLEHGGGKQLRVPAIARDVVNVEFRTGVAPNRAKQMTAFVDLERLMRVEHRLGRKVRSRDGSRWIGDVDGAYAEIHTSRDTRFRRLGRVIRAD